MRAGLAGAVAGMQLRGRRAATAWSGAVLLAAMAALAPGAVLAAQTTPTTSASQSSSSQAQSPQRSAFMPSTVFVQAGVAEDAEMAIIGATWDWGWHRDFRIGRLSGYWEASVGRWSSDIGDGGNAWVTQIGVTPVLRLYPQSWGGRWFVEGGIGFNLLQPIYRSADKSFSTAFNFGDHLAVGRRFGDTGRHEVALRFQHFSNAGIKSPNPGEDFLQLRYSWHF